MLILLILGVLLWSGAHYFKRFMPEARAQLGDKGKVLIAAGIGAALVLMIVGYRGAAFIPLWTPPAFLTHLNNLLMVVAFYFYAASGAKTALTQRIRHPQLTGFKIWAGAHLLVNGNLASVLLFGGLLAWAVGSVILINRAQPTWVPPVQAPARKEVTTLLITLVVVVVVMLIHNWLGVQPWGGA